MRDTTAIPGARSRCAGASGFAMVDGLATERVAGDLLRMQKSSFTRRKGDGSLQVMGEGDSVYSIVFLCALLLMLGCGILVASRNRAGKVFLIAGRV